MNGPLMVKTGSGRMLTFIESEVVHVFASVTVTWYVVLEVGVATGFEIAELLKVAAGDQL